MELLVHTSCPLRLAYYSREARIGKPLVFQKPLFTPGLDVSSRRRLHVYHVKAQNADKISNSSTSRQPLSKGLKLHAIAADKEQVFQGGSVEEQGREQLESASFNWATQWYPVAPLLDMDKSVPYPFEILGQKVVFWYDPINNQWNCFRDRCPHRLAPLSEGRIEPSTGCLQCNYHAWSFRSDGSCANIPQVASGEPFVRATANPRSHAEVFPVKATQGMLFIWADSSTAAQAAETTPPITPGIEDPGWQSVGTFRDLDYNWDTAMENLMDPSHVPVAHHNVNGGVMGKRTDAKPLPISITESGPWGFKGILTKENAPATNHVFQPPSRFTYDFHSTRQKDWRGIVTTYATPTAPGRCRIIVVNARNFLLGLSSGPARWQLLPRWFDHQLMLNLLDGDLPLLHGQERELRAMGGENAANWSKAFFMPAVADKYVAALRTWLIKFAGGGPAWVSGMDSRLPPLIADRQKLLDRYHGHTKQCTACSGALVGFQKAQKVLYVLTAVFLGLAISLATSPSAPRGPLVVAAAVTAIIGWSLNSWIDSFTYKGWENK